MIGDPLELPCDKIVRLERENAKLREALEHFRANLSTMSGAGPAYTIMATGQKKLREALGS